MSSKIINFEEEANNKKQNSMHHCFGDLLEFIQMSMDVLKELEHDIDNDLQRISKIVKKKSADFVANYESKVIFWNALLNGDDPRIEFKTMPENDIYYRISFEIDLENQIIYSYLDKWENDEMVSVYHPEVKEWEGMEEANIEWCNEIINTNSGEADIVRILLFENVYIKEDYQKIKEKYEKLFKLYENTRSFMEPYCEKDKNGKISLYLEPKDYFRKGLRIGMEKDQFILMQYLDLWNMTDLLIPSNDDIYNDELLYPSTKDYEKIVGRTGDLKKMEKILSRFVNRYADDFVLTLPVSLDQYVETSDLNKLICYYEQYKKKLNDTEFANLKQFCRYIKNHVYNKKLGKE